MRPLTDGEASREISLDDPNESSGSFLEVVLGSLRVKDMGTFEHGSSVRALAELVGRELGLRALDLWRLAEAALFHDVGKVCIPTEILMKQGPLTLDEKGVMATHPELGQRLLEEVPGYEMVGAIVRACHENFDGSGYPDGLAGDDIPVEARIITVVDSYDALITRRSYKEPVDASEARMVIASGAGTRFDPHVVAAFIGIFETAAV
jgi:HD-GYP domain-containing protein (c-di-GMP phosphodiesterase class II)